MKESFAGRFDESATPGHVEAGQDSPAKTVWRAEEGEMIDTSYPLPPLRSIHLGKLPSSPPARFEG